VGERIVGRHTEPRRIAGWNIHVDAEDLPKQLLRILSAVLGIIGAAAVAHSDIQVAVRSERETPAVVVGIGLLNVTQACGPHEIKPRCGIRKVGIARPTKSRHDRVAGSIGEVHKEAAGTGVVGRKREPEQPPLTARADGLRQIEKRRFEQNAFDDRPYEPVLLDHELYRRIGRIGH
jgi:hypothetical protein